MDDHRGYLSTRKNERTGWTMPCSYANLAVIVCVSALSYGRSRAKDIRHDAFFSTISSSSCVSCFFWESAPLVESWTDGLKNSELMEVHAKHFRIDLKSCFWSKDGGG